MLFPKERTSGCTRKFILFSAVAKWTEIRKNNLSLNSGNYLFLIMKKANYFSLHKMADYPER